MHEWLSHTLNQAVSSGSAAVYLLVFLGGVAASITPCTYPVLPLTVGYIGAAAEGNRTRAAVMSVALVVGMALVYAVAGTVFAAVGLQIGSIWANGWAVFAIAWFFILMSLFLLDVFTFPVPRFLGSLSSSVDTRRRGILGALLVGGVSGLVVGPCTGPILAVVLVTVTTTLHETHGLACALAALSGGFKLFVFGLGQGALLVACGVFAGILGHLPQSGRWLVTVKKTFALLILAGAGLLLVYVGQETDFPNLMQALGRWESPAPPAESKTAGPAPRQTAAPAAEPAVRSPAPAHARAEVQAPEKRPSGQGPLLSSEKPGTPPQARVVSQAPRENLAADFTLQAYGGGSFTLSRQRGKRGIVLVFFSTTCPHCMAEVDQLKAFTARARGRNVELYGISDRPLEVIQRFVRQRKVNYPILYDPGWKVGRRYGALRIPLVVGIDAAGVVRHYGGALPPDTDRFIQVLTRPLR